ncbi:MAG: hypothetical protein AAF991_07520 [Pseudomonadota bacterium]
MSFQPKKNPNPQGKGLVPVLADWASTRPMEFRARSSADLLFDWFVSTLVLSADFSFKPVVGQQYYLYLGGEVWSLSLIAPHEWHRLRSPKCLARCELLPDMTWAMRPLEGLEPDQELLGSLRARLEAFLTELDSDQPLEQALPGYRRDIPYYARMLATALGTSLRASAGAQSYEDRRSNGADLQSVAKNASENAPQSVLSLPARELRIAAQEQLSERLLLLAKK